MIAELKVLVVEFTSMKTLLVTLFYKMFMVVGRCVTNIIPSFANMTFKRSDGFLLRNIINFIFTVLHEAQINASSILKRYKSTEVLINLETHVL